MQIQSNSISNGYFADKFGHRGTQFLNDKKPNRSFYLSWNKNELSENASVEKNYWKELRAGLHHLFQRPGN